MQNAAAAMAAAGAGFFGWHFVASGLRQRPRAWSEVCIGGGLPIGILCTVAANALRHAGHARPVWLAACGWLGTALLLGGWIVGDQEALRARPSAWGDPPRVAGLRRAHWAVITCALAGTTAALLAIPGDDLARFSFLPAMGAEVAGFAWLRAHLRQRPPGWLMRLGGRSERTPDAPQSSAA